MIVTRADVAYLFSKPVRLVRTILAMNVLGPIVAVIVCQFFVLHPAVIVALVTLSMTPVGARLQFYRYASLQEARISRT